MSRIFMCSLCCRNVGDGLQGICYNCLLPQFFNEPTNRESNYNTPNSKISNLKSFLNGMNSLVNPSDMFKTEFGMEGVNCKYYDTAEFNSVCNNVEPKGLSFLILPL